MMSNYETFMVIGPDGNELEQIHRIDADGTVWVIPTDTANSDYQRYLRWLENPDAEQYTPPLPIMIEEIVEEIVEEATEAITEEETKAITEEPTEPLTEETQQGE